MSNPQTYYTVGNVDLSSIFQPLSSGSNIGFNTSYNVAGYGDLRNIFASLGSGSSIGYNTGYSVSGHGDLSTIFAANVYLISNSNFLTVASLNNNGYTGLIFETTYIPTGSADTDFGYCDIQFINITTKTINFLVVGGGGGGAAGYVDSFCGGGGGGGAGFINDAISVSNNDSLNIQVAPGGIGRKSTNPGTGNSSGSGGGTSFISNPTNDLSFNAYGGGPAFGIGSTVMESDV